MGIGIGMGGWEDGEGVGFWGLGEGAWIFFFFEKKRE